MWACRCAVKYVSMGVKVCQCGYVGGDSIDVARGGVASPDVAGSNMYNA